MMQQGTSGSKRKVVASETDVPAKRSTGVVVPEEFAALLRTVASSINSVTLSLMDLPCADVVARGRLVAALAGSRSQLNNALGVKKRVRLMMR